MGFWTTEGGVLLQISGFHTPQVMINVETQAEEKGQI